MIVMLKNKWQNVSRLSHLLLQERNFPSFRVAFGFDSRNINTSRYVSAVIIFAVPVNFGHSGWK